MTQQTQKTLSQDNIEVFYHDNFIKSQVKDFIKLFGVSINQILGKVIDVGGGYGFFAKELQDRTDLEVMVVDTDFQSIHECKQAGVDAAYGDALNPNIVGNEGVVCFNLILHHLVGKSDEETRNLQMRALSVWHSEVPTIFVNEYIYESYGINGLSGWLIYQITSNTTLSKLGNLVAKVMPSLKANTFGVGVRFRPHEEWKSMFESLGFKVIDTVIGQQEGISFPRRMLLIKNCRRDSFLLEPKYTNEETIIARK